MKQNEKGITIVGLLLTVIVIVAIAGVCIYTGSDIIKEAKLEQLKTNMLLIQAKCQSIGERVDAKELTQSDYIGTAATSVPGVTIETGDIWYGLKEKDIEEQEYIEGTVTKKGIGLGDVVTPQNANDVLYFVNYKNGEVVYANGYNGIYKLSEILVTDI